MLIDVDVVDGGGISRATKNDEGYNGGGRRPSPPRATVVDDDVPAHRHRHTHHRARSSPPPSALSVDPPDDGGGGARIVVASADDRAIRRERSRREGCGGRGGGGARWIAWIVFSGAGRGENGGGEIGTRDVVEDDCRHTRCDPWRRRSDEEEEDDGGGRGREEDGGDKKGCVGKEVNLHQPLRQRLRYRGGRFSSGKNQNYWPGYTAPVLVPVTLVFLGLFSHTLKIKPTLDNTLVDITPSFFLL